MNHKRVVNWLPKVILATLIWSGLWWWAEHRSQRGVPLPSSPSKLSQPVRFQAYDRTMGLPAPPPQQLVSLSHRPPPTWLDKLPSTAAVAEGARMSASGWGEQVVDQFIMAQRNIFFDKQKFAQELLLKQPQAPWHLAQHLQDMQQLEAALSEQSWEGTVLTRIQAFDLLQVLVQQSKEDEQAVAMLERWLQLPLPEAESALKISLAEKYEVAMMLAKLAPHKARQLVESLQPRDLAELLAPALYGLPLGESSPG